MSNRDRIRVLIADDHAIVRDGLAALIGRQKDMHVVGEASNGSEAVELFRVHQPDILLMDIQMPVTDGITATKTILSEFPGACIIGVTVADADRCEAMLHAGAAAYLYKDAPPAELFAAMRKACAI